jgi:L-histidine Nalpha-methyltransferase
LFDKICNTKEYYLARTESRLLELHALELIELTKPKHILEFGSGCSRKTIFLMQVCEFANINCKYLPFDVYEEMLHQVRGEYVERYQWLDVKPLIGDYTVGLDDFHRPEGSCLYVFLGSNIGNFNLQQANELIEEVTACILPGDSFLLGVDRVKPKQVLHRHTMMKMG